jgi:hypothetical protein
MCSISNEVCILLLLENSYDCWVDVHKNKMEGATIIDCSVEGRDEKRKCRWESDVSPKYTNGGIVYSNDCKMSHKGWKDAGIWHFNVLCHHVSNRVDHTTVLTDLVRLWKEGMHQAKKVPIEDDLTGTEGYHELWDDEPEPAAVDMEEMVATSV